jgi:GNAT superfamily N-acetyltransferase
MLRRMRKEDIPALVEMSRDNMASVIRSAWGMEWRDELLIETLLDTENMTEVLEGEAGLVGYHSIAKKGDTMFINSIQVNQSMQGKGMGKTLMRRIESLARINGLERVELWVQSTNTGAIGFYSTLGYVCTERKGNNYLMVKELDR